MRYQHVTSGAVVNVRDDKALGAEWEVVGGTTDDDGGYSSMKVDELKSEINSRNDGRDEADLIPLEGKKADLVAALEADDAANS